MILYLYSSVNDVINDAIYSFLFLFSVCHAPSFSLDGLYQKVEVFQRMLDHAHKLRLASHCLEDAFDRYAPTPDFNCESYLLYIIIYIYMYIYMTVAVHS